MYTTDGGGHDSNTITRDAMSRPAAVSSQLLLLLWSVSE